MNRRRPWLRSPGIGLVLALVLAVVAAGFQGSVYERARVSSVQAQQARIGETVTLDGTEIVVTSVTVAPALPAAEAEDPPVGGPAGSVLVLVVFTQLVDSSVDRTTRTCSSTLVADDGTVWETDDDYGYRLRRPAELICGDTESSPLQPGVLREIGVSYLIPARYADRVRWRLSMDDRYLVEVRR